MSTYPPEDNRSPADDSDSSQWSTPAAGDQPTGSDAGDQPYSGQRYADAPDQPQPGSDPYAAGSSAGDPQPPVASPYAGGSHDAGGHTGSQGNYPAPPPPNAPQYQQPYGGPMDDGPDAGNRITLNFWLSVFFTWIPALIFYLTEQNKTGRAMEYHKANLNFSLLRLFVGIFAVIPFVGWIVGGIASIVLFVIQIIAAINAPKQFAAGEPTYRYPFNIPLIK